VLSVGAVRDLRDPAHQKSAGSRPGRWDTGAR